MTINATDIKLLESEVMADTSDGGGRRTSRVIPDGVSGNIFPKVSRLDSTYGRVNLRKIFGAVQTANVDTYAGSHAIITDAPDNGKIHTTLFSTASEFDNRTNARDRIESYVTSAPESRMVLFGRQLAGQQNITVYQRIEEPLPEIGEVYCLSTESGSSVTAYQYFRVQDIDSEIRTFSEYVGSSLVEFKRRVITIGIGVALRYDFSGPESPSQVSNVARPSKVRTTTVVDAARYFGIQPTVESAHVNALTVKVSSVYTPLVPTTNRETPIVNAEPSGALNMVATGASRSENLGSDTWYAGSTTRRTLRGIKPGTLTLSGSFGSITDNKLGYIGNSSFAATVDYESGVIVQTSGSATGTTTATYVPAANDSQAAHTMEIDVTLANRGTVYVFNLKPTPAPGAAFFDYRALGKWYRLRDKGNGAISGDDSAYGVGTIDYASGTVVLTLGALPDIGSSVISSWGSGAHYAIRDGGGSVSAASVQHKFKLTNTPVAADSVSVTYTAGGVQYTAADNAGGAISGGGITGTVNYFTGDVVLNFSTRLPDSASAVSVSYEKVVASVEGEEVSHTLNTTASGTISLGGAVTAGSLNGTLKFGQSDSQSVYVKDNGSGMLVVQAGQIVGNAGGLQNCVTASDTVVGTVNYSTGELVINQGVTLNGNAYQSALVNTGNVNFALAPAGVYSSASTVAGSGSWSTSQTTAGLVSGSVANFGWRGNTATVTASASDSIQFSTYPLQLNMTATIGDSIVPGSVLVRIGGRTYIDRSGSLYCDISSLTGSGTIGGTIDYTTGDISLSYWSGNATPSIAVDSCLCRYGEYSTAELVFRTAGNPLRPGSFYLQVSSVSGELLSGTANTNGILSGGKINCNVDHDTGIVRMQFGEMVTAAGHESEYWYDADNVVAGQIWKPIFVIPSSLRYNAVVLANLPLNADILGLDPVRLPMDGRVPIYRPADVAVIHHTSATTLANPVVAGSTYSAGRTNLAELWLVDQQGTKLSSSQYAVNLDTGAITIAADFSAGSLVQPLIAKHRIEDMTLLTDVQINGQLTLASPLTRDYPTGSYVSSALLFGDMNARVTNVHDLQAFASWTDTPGTGSSAQFNNIDYPIEVLNNGAVTERWRINFTSTTAFQVIGENLGVIATGTTGTDCAPTNALTGLPYFVIRAAGWGSGWSAGNQLRFNTISASAPIWIARTVLPGATLEGDSFSLQVRGDVDAE